MTSGLLPRMVADKNGIEFKQAGVIITVDGTVYPGAPGIPIPGIGGFSSEIVYQLMLRRDGLWGHFFVQYPAAIFPMLPGIKIAVAIILAFIARLPLGTKIVLTGYSQGAIITDMVWLNILDPNSPLHNRADDVIRIYNFGDPMRCPGISNGNLMIGQEIPADDDGAVTGGIAGPLCLRPEQTPSMLKSFNNVGDLYGAAPVGKTPWVSETPSGAIETRVYNTIVNGTFAAALKNLVLVAEALESPIKTVVGAFNAAYNGLSFAAKGINAPHWHYEAAQEAAIVELIEIGEGLIAA